MARVGASLATRNPLSNLARSPDSAAISCVIGAFGARFLRRSRFGTVWRLRSETHFASITDMSYPNAVPPTMPVRQMRVGDIVHDHGMRCLVVAEPTRSTSHPTHAGGCYFTSAVVVNRDDVPNDHVPYSFTPRDDAGQARWSLQGNDLATYVVERA